MLKACEILELFSSRVCLNYMTNVMAYSTKLGSSAVFCLRANVQVDLNSQQNLI